MPAQLAIECCCDFCRDLITGNVLVKCAQLRKKPVVCMQMPAHLGIERHHTLHNLQGM